MGDENLKERENFHRLCDLMIGKGTKALRQVFDSIHAPDELRDILQEKQPELNRLPFINTNQWNLLFPPSGDEPQSNEFDISLLSILLRHVCVLTPPARTGWSEMPEDDDTSLAANIVRLRLYRNEINHFANTEITEDDFNDLWSKISRTLTDLGVEENEIDNLKRSPLSLEEKRSAKMLEDWRKQDETTQEKLDELRRDTKEMKETLNEMRRDPDDNLLLQLSKFNFEGDIETFVNDFHPGTRKWLFKKVKKWFLKKKSKIFVLKATSGFGKTTLAAKIVQRYKKKNELAACHFFKLNNTNYSNPMRMIQSLASQICDSVKGFKEKLLEQLKRPNEVKNLQDAFQVYLKEPLRELHKQRRINRMLVVIDGLDECERNGKTDLLAVLTEEFSKLPIWLKVLVTSGPEITIKETLNSLECIEILSTHTKHKEDIKQYLQSKLSGVRDVNISTIAEESEGSFLAAFKLQQQYLRQSQTTSI